MIPSRQPSRTSYRVPSATAAQRLSMPIGYRRPPISACTSTFRHPFRRIVYRAARATAGVQRRRCSAEPDRRTRTAKLTWLSALRAILRPGESLAMIRPEWRRRARARLRDARAEAQGSPAGARARAIPRTMCLRRPRTVSGNCPQGRRGRCGFHRSKKPLRGDGCRLDAVILTDEGSTTVAEHTRMACLWRVHRGTVRHAHSAR